MQGMLRMLRQRLAQPGAANLSAGVGVVLLALACGSSDGNGNGDGNGKESDTGGAQDLTGADELIAEVDESTGAPAECARDMYTAERVDVNIYLVLDVSASMDAPVAADTDATQWDAVRTAVTEFIESPDSAGINLALNYYPVMGPRSDCGVGGSCGTGALCVASVCDLRFVYGGVYVPCTSDDECPAFIEDVDGQVYEEQCVLPGRCDNAEFEPCLLDEQCPSGGTCVATDAPGLCPGEVSCEASDYSSPSVPRGALPDQAPQAVESLLGREPDMFSNTPTHVAMAGAYLEVDRWIQADPNTRSFVVLATDGAPVGCAPGATREQALAEATQRTFDTIQVGSDFGIDTFVIGVYLDVSGFEGQDAELLSQEVEILRGQLTEMAQIGGTGTPYEVTANLNATDAFLEALAEIRGEVLPCEYKIPEPDGGNVALDELNVVLTSGADPETVPKVESLDDCMEGENSWYYNVDDAEQTPTAVVLCPDTCSNANAQEGNQIDIVLGCQTVVRDVR